MKSKNILSTEDKDSAELQEAGVSPETAVQAEAFKKTSRLAIASMVCLLLAIACVLLLMCDIGDFFFALACGLFPSAFVLSVIACITIAYNKHLKGYGYTIVPLVLGAYVIFSMVVAYSAVGRRAKFEKANTPRYNFRLLGKTIVEYSQHNNGYLPVADQWCDLLMEYDKSLSKDNFKHPKEPSSAIAFNKNLDGLRLADVPGNVVLLFVAYGGWNHVGGEELFEQRHMKLVESAHTEEGVLTKVVFSDVLLVDGSIKHYWKEGYRNYSEDNFKPLRWKP